MGAALKKPDGVFGTGVSVREARLVSDKPNADFMHMRLVLRAMIEKIDCIEKAKTLNEVREIVKRQEWLEENDE